MLDKLLELGLDERDARFYLAVLEKDAPTVAGVARSVGVSRTNGYDIAKRLTQRGLLSATETSRPGERPRVELHATDPQYLLVEWEARKRLLEHLVPQLRAMHPKTGRQPRARYLEGVAGIHSALMQTLDWPSPLRAILSMRDLFQVPGQDAMNEYVSTRIARGLHLRVIRSREREAGAAWSTSQREFREARFAPRNYVFTMSMVIGADSVALLSSSTENFALMIDSPEFADMHSNLFEILWEASNSAL